MVPNLALLYVGGWVVTTLATYVASRRVADGANTPLKSLWFSTLAGLVWPLMILGMIELSSLAVFATATSPRHDHEIPDAWLSGDELDGVVVPLR